MKFHQIEAFYQVMLTGSISQAAANLGRTQPAVSMTISTLEDLSGARLSDRHAGRLSARAEAHVLFEQVGPVMRQIQDIRARFSGVSAFPVPRLSIIAASNPGTHVIPAAIAPLAAKGQEFRLMNGSSATVVAELENQRHDLGVTDEGPAEIRLSSPLYEAEEFEVPGCALYPKGLMGSVGRSVSRDQITQHPVCMLYAQHGMATDPRSSSALDRLRNLKEVVGDQAELMIDLSGGLNNDQLLRILDLCEEMKVMWVEEPLDAYNLTGLKGLAGRFRFPVAAGERVYTRNGFRNLLDTGAIDVVMPDVGNCGGVYELLQIAAMAKAYNTRVSPHNCASSLCTAASLQVWAACANAMPLEIYPYLPESQGYVQVLDDAPEDRIRDGWLEVSDAPGLGATVNAERLKPYRMFDFRGENG